MILKSHYFWRTYLGYVILALLGTFAFAVLMLPEAERQVRENLAESMKITLESLSRVTAQSIQRLDYQGIRQEAAEISNVTSMRVTVIDRNGIVLADSHEDPFSMDNHLRRPEIQTAYSRGEGTAQRYSYTLEEDFLYVARPVNYQGNITGFVRVAKSATAHQREIREAQTALLKNSAFITFLVLLAAFYLSARQTHKINELTQTAEEIARGNFSRRVPEGNDLGLKKMAEAINQMARSSARSVSEITADRNRLSTVFTCMVEGVIDVDMDQNILHMNESAARLLSLDASQCIGKPIWQETRNQEIISALDEAIRTRSVIKTQLRLNRASDQLVVDIYAASLSDDEGDPIGAVLMLHDITDIKNLERIRTDFVANASHELKTPITAIRGMTETILGDEEVEKDTMLHFIGRVHAQSLRLSQLVGDLMTISRLENSQNREDFARINFSDLVRQAIRTAQVAAEEKGHTLIAELPEGELALYADRQNMNQLVDNLIDNAIKYTEKSGTITVSLGKEDGWAVFRVQDTGLGISPQYQQRVFERFYRVDKARSQSLGGTGLGLSIVKNIAEKHGGSVHVDSQLGRGSTFTIRLPLEG